MFVNVCLDLLKLVAVKRTSVAWREPIQFQSVSKRAIVCAVRELFWIPDTCGESRLNRMRLMQGRFTGTETSSSPWIEGLLSHNETFVNVL